MAEETEEETYRLEALEEGKLSKGQKPVCAQYFIDHPCQVGGPEKVVEIWKTQVQQKTIS